MWQPSASIEHIRYRARVYSKIREFFNIHGVMEVDVPVLGRRTITDPHLEPIRAKFRDETLFMQTSPEFFMKRMLAAGSGSIYYLGKAFRDDEFGSRHNPEFTMLEWYREGFDDGELMDETIALIKFLDADIGVDKYSYRELFERSFGTNPHSASEDELAQIAKEKLDIEWNDTDKNTWLDLLFSHFIEPALNRLTIVYDYPASQCALAKVKRNPDGEPVAKRFEVFWKGVELANAYWELTDPLVQRERFESDLKLRNTMERPLPELDEKFLAAMESTMPECAGIALGVDRLLMCLLGESDIASTLAFPYKHL